MCQRVYSHQSVPWRQVYLYRVSSHQRVPWRQVLLYKGCPLISVSLGDRFYCIKGVLSSACPLETGFTVWRVSSHQRVPWRQVYLYRWCPLIGVSLEEGFIVDRDASYLLADKNNFEDIKHQSDFLLLCF